MRETIKYILDDIQKSGTGRNGLDQLKKIVRRYLPQNLECTGSTGSGQKTDCVYFRIFDRQVSKTSTAGYHLVYIFSKDGQRVYLSLNARGHEKLTILQRVEKIQQLLKLNVEDSKMDLKGSADSLSNTAQMRQIGDAFSIAYRYENLPDDDQFRNELSKMIGFYNSLIEMGLNFEKNPEEEKDEEEEYKLEQRTMSTLDTIMIKLGVSYREGISEEELYQATSVSWKLSESKLESGDYKYYCAVYSNKIKEVYEITGFDKDLRLDRIGRFILKGKIANEFLRSKLLEISIGTIHTSSGNPIKYTSIERLLELAEHINENGNESEKVIEDTLFDDDLFISESMQEKIVRLLKYKKNVILQGPPGVGKTFAAKKLLHKWFSAASSQMLQVQFHQSYSYEDFIEGYRPNEDGHYELQDGLFKRFVKKAIEDRHRDYFVLIDEINRGNLSKIFGELFMLIEQDKRGEAVQLAYSKRHFSVPENLYFIGTMNTSDRSLANIDFAMRRRFSFIYIEPAFEDEGLTKFINYLTLYGISTETTERIVRNVRQVNEVIKTDYRLGKGFEIGHAYFTNFNNLIDENEWYENIIEFELIPLIEEYYFDDDARSLELKGILMQ